MFRPPLKKLSAKRRKPARKQEGPRPVYRKDYKAPAYLVDTAALDFDIRDKRTRVAATLQMRRNPARTEKNLPLWLDGEGQDLISVSLNGRTLSARDYALSEHGLQIKKVPAKFTVEIVSAHDPQKNTTLSGLYASGGMLSTQCEAEGFRRIAYYPDRPDVLAKFTVRIEADAKTYPVLLSNGNLLAKGKAGGGRHWVKWRDPHPKPCYLFALVAGRLGKVSDRFVTKDRRRVLLEIYTEPGNGDRVKIAMDALKAAMRWDEKAYGLSYDLDRFMIVAVSFFNMGAMENKGLNIFNSDCILARPDIATDADIAFVERVVGHEYFHNWTGNRITCRDWFQLSLKEGLTVFREQQFVGAMHDDALERVRAVRALRSRQFAEDAGPTAHPVRPDSYLTIDNFYTATVYEKGAEVCRMLHTLLGAEGWRRGMQLYVKRHDGSAATCDDFAAAMADANRMDRAQFMRWYEQAGTPRLAVTSKYNARQKMLSLTVRQSCPPTPGQAAKKPFHMPFAVGLLDSEGRDMGGTHVLQLRAPVERFSFTKVPEKPVLSLLRGFSAPVRLEYNYSDEDLLFLLAHDSDAFSRYEAGQTLMRKYLLAAMKGKKTAAPPPAFTDALARVLADRAIAPAMTALMLALPSEHEIGLELAARGQLIDPDRVHRARESVRGQIAGRLEADFAARMQGLKPDARKADGKTQGVRALRNLCLGYLMAADEKAYAPAAMKQLRSSNSMTDQVVALALLASSAAPERKPALDHFYRRWQNHELVINKWLAVQAGASRTDTAAAVAALLRHKAYDRKNPNKLRALAGAFGHGNPWRFHAPDGSGYRLVAAEVRAADRLNPQAAARLALAFEQWRAFEPKRQKLMEKELKALRALGAGKGGISRNLFEIVDKALVAGKKPRK
ncbi:MAG: aminopeptidase N [Alphaproteobacteria bacterium]|nr:aminopeptidase N [Alphaproteobacteria bacterium]